MRCIPFPEAKNLQYNINYNKDTNLKMKESKCYDEITLCLQVNKKIGEMKVDVLEHESLNKIMEIPPQILSDIKRQIEEISEFLFQQEEIRKE